VGYQQIIRDPRQGAGLSVSELARRSGTTRPTLTAYEQGRKAPTVPVLEGVLDAAGFAIAIVQKTTFREVPGFDGRAVNVPDRLPRLVGPGEPACPRPAV